MKYDAVALVDACTIMRYQCGMAPKMPTYASRQRAAEAFQLRASRLSWREIADRLGYRSIGAAQTAVNRHVERLRRESTATSFESHKAAIETRTRAMSQRFAAAFKAQDDDTLVTLNREIVRNEIELAKLGGLYEPEQVNVNVTQTASAIIADTRERLLELLNEREQRQLPGTNIIEGEVVK